MPAGAHRSIELRLEGFSTATLSWARPRRARATHKDARRVRRAFASERFVRSAAFAHTTSQRACAEAQEGSRWLPRLFWRYMNGGVPCRLTVFLLFCWSA